MMHFQALQWTVAENIPEATEACLQHFPLQHTLNLLRTSNVYSCSTRKSTDNWHAKNAAHCIYNQFRLAVSTPSFPFPKWGHGEALIRYRVIQILVMKWLYNYWGREGAFQALTIESTIKIVESLRKTWTWNCHLKGLCNKFTKHKNAWEFG